MEDGLVGISGPPMPRNDPPRKAGRPRKYPHASSLKPTTDDVLEKLPPLSIPMVASTHKGSKAASGRPKTKTTRKRRYHTAVTMPGVDESREFFDLNAISADSDDSDDGVPPAPTEMNSDESSADHPCRSFSPASRHTKAFAGHPRATHTTLFECWWWHFVLLCRRADRVKVEELPRF